MFTTMRSRHLIIPLDDRELTVEVDGDDAVLHLQPASPPGPTDPDGDAPDGEVPDGDAPGAEVRAPRDAGPLRLRLPARALVAALRVAWADEHDRRRFEPWRRGDRYDDGYGYRSGYDRSGYDRYGYDGYGYDRYGDGDLGDGDPDGYRDPTVVPFRMPAPPPRPARAGQPWERQEEQELRDLWLAAAPEVDRADLMRQIAQALERPVGGLFVRLQVVGCDPTRPGRRRYEVDDEVDDTVDADDEYESG